MGSEEREARQEGSAPTECPSLRLILLSLLYLSTR